ncbi:unnamed protein product [Hymenolepis diminuta]|uniref:Uncharacterized protein n=1 Tax=Hymenolepis diminuta TaxID=6216 RepID=A0A564Y2Y2_HYMDI|nr:unnamed protein product [Hymenolepis diminuta]
MKLLPSVRDSEKVMNLAHFREPSSPRVVPKRLVSEAYRAQTTIIPEILSTLSPG